MNQKYINEIIDENKKLKQQLYRKKYYEKNKSKLLQYSKAYYKKMRGGKYGYNSNWKGPAPPGLVCTKGVIIVSFM